MPASVRSWPSRRHRGRGGAGPWLAVVAFGWTLRVFIHASTSAFVAVSRLDTRNEAKSRPAASTKARGVIPSSLSQLRRSIKVSIGLLVPDSRSTAANSRRQ